jgi:predicted Zn-dependent protease
MALLQPTPHGGGVVMIFRETTIAVLATAVRHELGHVLGLQHDPASRLMSPIHDPRVQQCIDKATVAAVARMRSLPLDQLNWCEDNPTAG